MRTMRQHKSIALDQEGEKNIYINCKVLNPNNLFIFLKVRHSQTDLVLFKFKFKLQTSVRITMQMPLVTFTRYRSATTSIMQPK